MGFSIESAIIVPISIVILTAVAMKSFDAYQDVRLNTRREVHQSKERIDSDAIYRLRYTDDGFPADVQTNPLDLLRFCIYLEDQGEFLLEVFGDD